MSERPVLIERIDIESVYGFTERHRHHDQGHGLMAGPADGNKAVSHLSFEAIEARIPDAVAACE